MTTKVEDDLMTAVPTTKLTVAEYLAIERNAERKSEYYRGEMFAMAGATPAHNFIKSNIEGELFGRLKGGPCRTASSDQRVLVEFTGLFTYPDVIVFCGEPQYSEDDPNSLINPRVIVEVLSPSTERYDRTTKFRQYQQMPTMQEYILVSQEEALVEQYVRQDDGSWKYYSYVGPEAQLQLATVPATPIPMADVFRSVEVRSEAH